MVELHNFLVGPKGAVISPCGEYRYVLWRVWDARLPLALFICLNSSKADAFRNDPTTINIIKITAAAGAGGFLLGNLFAFRASKPAAMKKAADPVGPDNDEWLRHLSERCPLAVAAWGAHGSFRNRGETVAAFFPRLYHLGFTQGGQPRHPLFLNPATPLTPWVR